MLVRKLSPEGVDLAGVGSHINWRKERVTRMLGREGGWIVRDPTSVEEENETPFIRVWKLLSSIRVLKTLRGNP